MENRIENILTVNDLQKSYPGFQLRMNLAIPKGCIMGLVGTNGAGKSTTIRLILGLAKPDGGSIDIMGSSDLNRDTVLREEIGVVFDECSFPESLTPPQLGSVLGRLHPRWDPFLWKDLLERLELTQPGLSYHMKVLCGSGLVESRQEGKWTHYRLSEEGRRQAVALLLDLTTPGS